MMDPVPSPALQNAVKAIQAIGGTFQYLWYHPAGWTDAKAKDYYGYDSNGKLYGPINSLVSLFKSGATKVSIGHYDIPSAMLLNYKSTIEQGLG
jgi:hypothetical protein